jgi:hypothetical protein
MCSADTEVHWQSRIEFISKNKFYPHNQEQSVSSVDSHWILTASFYLINRTAIYKRAALPR